MMNQMQMPGPMPGQAQGIQQVLPGMMPKQGAPTPQAMVGPLSQMHMQQLMQLMMNPRPDGPPLYAVIAAISEQQKKAQAQAAMQRQGAMAQGQQAAQQPPVAQEVMAQAQQMQPEEPVMAAYGGEMHGYAGGGAVAFEDGGETEDLSDDPSLSLRERMVRAEKRRALSRQQGVGRSFAERFPAPVESTTDTGDERSRMLLRAPAPAPVMSPEAQALTNRQGPRGNMVADKPRVAQPTATTFDITNPASINALRMAAQDTSLPEAERADLQRRIAMMEGNRPDQSGVASLAKPQANLTPEEEQYFANKASTLRTRQGLPEDVLAGRQGIATLAAENLAAQRAEREQMAREAKEQRDAALAKAQRGIMDDPMSLLALAGSIDTRRGKGIGSLARGAAGLMGIREVQAEAARKEFALAQRDQRMLQANERQANMLEMQRQQAIRENEWPRVSQIEDQLAALEVQKSQLVRSRQEHAEKMALEGRKVGAMEADAAAKLGRPTAIDFFRQDPEGYGRFIAAGRGPQTAGDRQDLNELKALQGNLQKQIENYALPKGVRDAAAAQLQQVNAKLAQMAGLDGAPIPTGGAARPSSQAEFNALPKGARYINPADGKEYIKN
jgi:hypothetical protein